MNTYSDYMQYIGITLHYVLLVRYKKYLTREKLRIETTRSEDTISSTWDFVDIL